MTRGAAAMPAQPGLVPVVADLANGTTARRALRLLPRLDAALVYAPFADVAICELLADAVDGRVVELFTSRWADPASGSDVLADLPSVGVPLLLGWAYGPDGQSRWHTPAEVSAAALDVLDSGWPAQLGAVRPWTNRPS